MAAGKRRPKPNPKTGTPVRLYERLGTKSNEMPPPITPSRKMGRVGHEHSPLKASKSPISSSGGAKSDAHDAPKLLLEPDLMKIVETWPELPEHIKAAIKALIQIHN